MSTPPQKRRWMIGVSSFAMVLALGLGARRILWPVDGHHPTSPLGLQSSRRVDRPVRETLELSAKMAEIMNIRTVPAIVPRYSRVLHLRGSLAIDPNRQIPVHARFPGQVVELATVRGLRSQQPDLSITDVHPLQTFDTVKIGSPMAVIWSKDLGEKKSQLCEALAKLRLDRQTLENFKKLTQSGSISDRDYREQRAKVELGEIAVITAEAILRSYQVTEDEIESVKSASERIHQRQQTDERFAGDWARVTVNAPISGVIVDKIVTVGQIVDANADLFRIADLGVLAIYLHAYEEDLPAIQKMQFPLPVALTVPANPNIGEMQAQIDRIGPIIDPNEHMALLIGIVKNPDIVVLGKDSQALLRVGQFITGDIGIPAQPGVVEIPSNALIDVGNDAIVYVQPDSKQHVYERRRVAVVQRQFDFVQVRCELTEQQKEQGLSEIHFDDLVISGGVLELEDYQSQQP